MRRSLFCLLPFLKSNTRKISWTLHYKPGCPTVGLPHLICSGAFKNHCSDVYWYGEDTTNFSVIWYIYVIWYMIIWYMIDSGRFGWVTSDGAFLLNISLLDVMSWALHKKSSSLQGNQIAKIWRWEYYQNVWVKVQVYMQLQVQKLELKSIGSTHTHTVQTLSFLRSQPKFFRNPDL